MSTAFVEARQRLTPLFEEALEAAMRAWERWPAALVEPARYALTTGGKRVRPVLALMAAEAAGGGAREAMPWAVALEMVHTYSLIHDDLPCMDDDAERRGCPTCHVKFGQAAAVLAGDGLLTEAFAVLARAAWPASRTVDLTALLAEAAGGLGMVGGQVIDSVGSAAPDLAALEDLHRRKTGALIRAAAEGGVRTIGSSAATVALMVRYGEALGLLFQITDDLIDRETDADAARNCYFAIVGETRVLARRDDEARAAREALSPLGAAGDALRGLADFVANRTA